MKEILYNYDNLTKDDIDEIVIRTKGLIINDNDEITLGYSHKTYQFPGGHLEEGETLSACLLREIKEETGIEITNAKIEPFEKITYYSKNYHNYGKNRQNEIYYYIIETNAVFDANKASLDDWEKEGNYVAKTIPLKEVEEVLINSIPDNPVVNKVIVEEMLDVLKEYNKIKTMQENKTD